MKRPGFYTAHRIPFLLVLLVAGIWACEPEEEQVSTSSGLQLRFSADTIIFDTILTEETSITRSFRIFNPNDKAIRISEIRLGGGVSSAYSLIINGQDTSEVTEEVLYGGDSLLVLVNVTIDPQDQNLPYLVKDSVVVVWNGNSANVKLVAWGQDAYYLYSETICDATWTADRPYVIYDALLVDSLCTLTVEPGTRIYINNDAAFYVKGTLKVLGDSSDHVIIRNTRMDNNYLVAPGQWDAIYFLEGSTSNEIYYAEIENGTIGLRVGSPDSDSEYDVVVGNTSIRHMSNAGILAFTSDIYGYNVEIYNVNNYLVGNFAGGNYRYEHCTFSNLYSDYSNDDPMIQFADNVVLSDDETLVADLSLEMINCILWGDGDDQFYLSTTGSVTVDTSLVSNVIRSSSVIPGNYVSTERNYPGFSDPYNFDYSLDSAAFCRDKGVQTAIETDILGHLRDSKPDIGAYERIDQ